ncbi:hypothetical protein JOC85_003289 [Bacillus mesophilus]|nr:hypothetical protein [Bacillus mesophilus]
MEKSNNDLYKGSVNRLVDFHYGFSILKHSLSILNKGVM